MSTLRADAIRARRRALGLSQRKLGAICGLNGTTVHRIETEEGAGRYLRLNHLHNLAAALGVEPAWLLREPAATPTDLPPPSATSGSQDAQVLGTLLIGKSPTSTQALAYSLGWTLDRMQHALTTLAGQLSNVGGALRQQSGMVEIVAALSRQAESPIIRITRLRLGTRPLSRDELRAFNEIREPGIDPRRLDWLLRQRITRRLSPDLS